MEYLSRSDATFESRLKSGWAWQHYVACWFRNNGIRVEEEAFRCRDRGADVERAKRGEFRDSCDLWLPEIKLGVEIKAKNLFFTHPADFPFQTVFVCNDASFQKIEKAARRRLAMVLISTISGGMVVVPWLPWNWKQGTANDGGYSYQVWQASKAELETMQWFLDMANVP